MNDGGSGGLMNGDDEAHGPLLRLRALKRTDMAAYLCIASNGVPPSVSKRIKVEVELSSLCYTLVQPLVYAPLQLVHAHYGQQMDIECYIEAFPPGLSYWKRPSGIEILHSDSKYKVTTYEGSGSYKSRMVLTIRSVQQSDIGEYNCISNNSQGGAEQEVLLSASMPVSSSQNTISKGSVKEGVLDRGQVDSEAKPSFEGIETLLKESFETNSKTSLLHGSPAPNNRVVGNLGGGDVTHEDLRSYKDPTTRQIHYNSGSHDFSPRQTFDLIAAGAAASVHNSVLKFCVQAVPAPACVGSHMTVREGIGLMKTCFAGWRSGRSFAYSAIENGIGIMETKSDECTSKGVEDCAFIKKGIGILQTDYAGCATGRNCTNSIRGEIVKEGTARQRVLEISFDLKVILSFFLLSAWSRMM
ncbi:Immunoglobulin I-set [Trinorchestia longiramus]|nr:Immunoglobulin I-set [Trinorchestia longiramus]